MHASTPTFQAPDSRNITQCGSRDIRLSPEPTAGRSTGGPQRDRTTAFFFFCVHILNSPHLFGLLAARCFPGSYHPLTIGGETSWCRWQAVSLQGMQRRSGSDMIRLGWLGIQARFEDMQDEAFYVIEMRC
ncbi:hypothetical protein FocTR4_00006312 [Fusarium oxysporum f. sp. cubense]|uniref:Uncharacterized protein n=2 Tax=Fusarium oxysporum species complex TaxID=171631 RepID=A0A5C6TMQ2_FUSOC|nr:hypothetical protein FocTR4_00006312 [Fusarium oxysporum f. sp. cubense]